MTTSLRVSKCAEDAVCCTEDLYGGGGLLGKIDQRARVCDQTRAHQLAHQHRQVRRDRHHPVLQVLEQLVPAQPIEHVHTNSFNDIIPQVWTNRYSLGALPVVGHFEYLSGEKFDVDEVLLGDLGSHRRFSRQLHRLLLLGVEHIRQVRRCEVPAVALMQERDTC